MANIDLNFHDVQEIVKSDIIRGSTHNHWIELTLKLANNETVTISCWAKEQDNLIIKKEEQ
jgi:hypothetical protein